MLIGDLALLVSDLHRLNRYLDPVDRRPLSKGLAELLVELSEFSLSGTGLTHPEAGPIIARHLAGAISEMDGRSADEEPEAAIDAVLRILQEAGPR